MTDFGYGQIDPQATSSEYNTRQFQIDQALALVRTATPVKVMAVTNTGGLSPVGFVDIQPIVNQLDGAGNKVVHGTVFNVPYFRLQGGASAVIIDPKVDDIGLAIICDRDISTVKATKDQANPGSFGRFDISDAIYLGGILNGDVTQYIQFNDDGVTIGSPTKVKMACGTMLVSVTPTRVDLGGLAGSPVQTVAGASTKVFAAV